MRSSKRNYAPVGRSVTAFHFFVYFAFFAAKIFSSAAETAAIQ
jgi:hypothetical protein